MTLIYIEMELERWHVLNSQNPTHKYTATGNYTFSLTVKNAKSSNAKKVSKYITVKK